MKKLNCILLIDDNPDDNFYHERIIRKNEIASQVLAKTSALDALNYLLQTKKHSAPPELILLDINMPGMNGWEFLAEYEKIDEELKSKAIVIMLTTSQNPDDKLKAESMTVVSDFKTKPLSNESLQEIMNRFFN